ncbi:MAG: beta-lactamase family protein [Bacteroidetes bacterium]|nr:beta-lactamase family protein [Bacteroidota bacterium]
MLFCFFSFCLAFGAKAQGNWARVDSWLDDNTGDMGGRSFFVVYKDGRIVHTHAFNDMSRRQKMVGKYLAKRSGRQPNLDDYTMDTRQPIASCSKWLSAALVMTFVNEGKLSLTDTIGRYLPVMTSHGKGNITISQCLSHLTGIKEPPLKQSLQELRAIKNMDEAVALIAGMPMEGAPGKTFHYSNAGLQLAGAVIEKISGKSFETLFAQRIAAPLGMTNTDFGKGPVAMPAGGAFSTPNDYTRFLSMILAKGVYNGKRLLSEKSIAAMQVNRITKDVRVAYSPTEAGDFGYGYGEWVMQSAGITTPSAAVTSPGLFGSFPWVDNQKGYCAFLMTFYLKNTGRNARYKELKALVDQSL